ncbi:hypothetical protein HPULCUR_003395 [Helicostylum pulchrum]|uniref:Alpha/beta hydrolase n=1 Tax=Helicostylum pulchrum TaxID=562976 RepID=A0ABP9XTA7_9FUNG
MPKLYLQVEEASIYFEAEGNGPYLIFIPRGVVEVHGYGQSKLTGPQDDKNRLETEADDIYRLMRSLTNQNFTLFGFRAGGAVSLKYLVKYLETLQKMSVHEPVVNPGALSDGKQLAQFRTDIHNAHRTKDMILY